jgi:hypothetical protein
VKKVISKKEAKTWVFYFYYCVLKFLAFLCELFLHILQRIWTWHKILYFMIPILNFCKQNLKLIFALFANFKAKHIWNAQKKSKMYFRMCLRIPFYIHSRSGSLHFVERSQNPSTLLNTPLFLLVALFSSECEIWTHLHFFWPRPFSTESDFKPCDS